MVGITWVESGIWLVYFSFILVVLMVYRSAKNETYYRFFLTGFILKVIGGVGFSLIYLYYYKSGDTFSYHSGSRILSQTLIDSPGDYFRLLATDGGNLPADLGEYVHSIKYAKGPETWFMVKLLSPIAFISFHSYIVMTLFMSLLSFIGGWALFKVFRDLLPRRENLAFIAAFVLPAVLYSGGGIMRDTFTLVGINFIIYGLYFTLFKNKFSASKYLLVLVSLYLVYYLKSYVLIAFVPGLLFGINAAIKSRMENLVLRRSLGLVFLAIIALIIYQGPKILARSAVQYSSAGIEGRIKGFHSWHSDLGGSTYDLGEIEYTATGIVSKIPAAINVTYFRPYLWEVSSPVVLLSAIESLILLLFFIYIVVKLRFRILRLIRQNPILIVFTIYCLIFGFIVGFTSYNFGALGRYKIPVYSLFVFVLFYLYDRLKMVEDESIE